MPHFIFETNDDGTIRRLLKDGESYGEPVRLEQHFSIVTIYFELAAINLGEMAECQEPDDRRRFGLQSFLMSLTGLEAFTNTFFSQRGQELERPQISERIAQTHGSLSQKIRELIALTPEGPIQDQGRLLDQIFVLSKLRHEIVHPRWEPASLTIQGRVPMTINGLVQNRQALFEDLQFCREANLWCLLVIARIAQARGNVDIKGFLFHWTHSFMLELSTILEGLGLAV